jgi:hypothetical protein
MAAKMVVYILRSEYLSSFQIAMAFKNSKQLDTYLSIFQMFQVFKCQVIGKNTG